MTSFLLLLSFLIHLLVLITIYHLYEKSKRTKNEQTEQLQKMLNDFMHDIRVENNKLEEKIYENELPKRVTSNNHPSSLSRTHEPIQSKKTDASSYDDVEIDALGMNDTETKSDFASHLAKASHTQEKEDIIETSIESQMMRLAQEGKSVDEIAKKLNRGKTEVELMLKWNQN